MESVSSIPVVDNTKYEYHVLNNQSSRPDINFYDDYGEWLILHNED